MSERTLSLGLTAPWMSRLTNHSKSSVGIRADSVCICIDRSLSRLRLHLPTNAYDCLRSADADDCQGPALRGSISLDVTRSVFDMTERRGAALLRGAGGLGAVKKLWPTSNHYCAGRSASLALVSLGASQKRAGRSNRKVRWIARATQNIVSAPSTPATVTKAEIVPTSLIQPSLISRARLTAIGRKKAR